jgi:hypothetical protein
VGVAANAVPAPPAISPMVSPAVTRAFVVEITATPFGGLIHDGRQDSASKVHRKMAHPVSWIKLFHSPGLVEIIRRIGPSVVYSARSFPLF